MPTFADRLIEQVVNNPGISDRELTDALVGKRNHPSQVNQEARLLEGRGILIRRKREDGVFRNYPAGSATVAVKPDKAPVIERTPERLSEDELKEALRTWLTCNGWSVRAAWGKSRGIDIKAERDGLRWIIEVKGLGSRQPMRVNYFIAILGETLQRMDDSNAKYSIALPDVPQFRGLWNRLPALAKHRTTISALFVSSEGDVVEES